MTEKQIRRYIMERLKVGGLIKTHKMDFREGQEYEKHLVIGFYPHHVLTVCPDSGDFECFVYADMLKFVREQE
jgi:hypothetical protein